MIVKLVAAIAVAVVLGLAGTGASRAQYVMDLGSLIAALRVGDFSGEVENLSNANRVYVERVSRLSGIKMSGDILDRTIAARGGVLRYLRAIIRQVPEAMKALERHGETLDEVIFLTTTNDGTAMLYVDDR
jgi:hypothetical protein